MKKCAPKRSSHDVDLSTRELFEREADSTSLYVGQYVSTDEVVPANQNHSKSNTSASHRTRKGLQKSESKTEEG